MATAARRSTTIAVPPDSSSSIGTCPPPATNGRRGRSLVGLDRLVWTRRLAYSPEKPGAVYHAGRPSTRGPIIEDKRQSVFAPSICRPQIAPKCKIIVDTLVHRWYIEGVMMEVSK